MIATGYSSDAARSFLAGRSDFKGDRVNLQDTLARIAEIVGPRGLLSGAAAEALLVDEQRLFRGSAALVVQPHHTAQCAAIIALCADAGIGVVPQGGSTGYCGGAKPSDAALQILLSTSRMNRIREVDPVGFTMTVDAGVVLARAQQAAAEADLLLPLSMGSEGSCQIGGNLATNAGGAGCRPLRNCPRSRARSRGRDAERHGAQ